MSAIINKIDNYTNIIYHTARIRIERTKTSKDQLAIEELYFPKLKKLFSLIIADIGTNIHLLHDTERKYGDETMIIIKSLVTRTYLLGMEYVARATNREHLISLSPNDLTQIMMQSTESYKAFWRLVTKYVQVSKNRERRNNNNKTNNNQFLKTAKTYFQDVLEHGMEGDNNFTVTDEVFNVSDDFDNRLIDRDTTTALIINGITTSIIAYATLTKYREVKQEMDTIDQAEAIDEFMITDQMTGEEGDSVVFATENDDKVCDTCQSYEGMEWPVDDPAIIVPRVDTHFRCRCRLLLKINGNIMAK